MNLQDLGCKFPDCECKVPDYAFSELNRLSFCKVSKRDLLVERDCAILDGNCRCIHPWDECKYLKDDKVDGHYDAKGRYILPDAGKELEK